MIPSPPEKKDSFRVMVLGDVVGRPGRTVVEQLVKPLRQALDIDMVIANGENAAGGAGIDPGTAREIREAGVDVITLGDHSFQRKGAKELLDGNSTWCIRPYNYPSGSPGKGMCVWRSPKGVSVTVVNLIGRVFVGGVQECPFRALDTALAQRPPEAGSIVVFDLHAEATSEKWAMGRYADGRVSLVVGTHTHVQTADAQILPGGTGYITDLGMCGSVEGVIGMSAEVALRRFLGPLPAPYQVAEGVSQATGVVADIDPLTGRASWIALLRESPASGMVSPGTDRP